MKLAIAGMIATMNFETAGLADTVVDFSTLPEAVKVEAMKFGFQTAMRNATAGKLEEVEKAKKAVDERVATWQKGDWKTAAEQKAAIELGEDERKGVIGRVIVMARRAKGDTRSEAEILAAFDGLDQDRQKGVLEALKKPIDKQIKDALRQKKLLSKAGAGSEF